MDSNRPASPAAFARILAALFVLWSCVPPHAASGAVSAPPPVAGGDNPDEQYQLPDDVSQLLALDDEMCAFFAQRVQQIAPVEKRLDQISEAILGEGGLHFRYEDTGTYDAREAFRRRRGNCVTFAVLFVAVAREYRLPAEFNEVSVRQSWSRAGELVIETRHLDVWVEVGNCGYEIDLQLRDDFRASRAYSHRVSDERAFAGLYSNDGVFRLATGRREEALRSLRRATEIEPNFAPVWGNLGQAYLVIGDEAEAWRCFGRALAIDPSHGSAVNGMAHLNRVAGRLEEADRYERRARRYRERNPYYLCALAREEFAGGDAEAARRHLARALRIKKDEPEFYREMVGVLRSLGREREAARWSRRLGRIADAEVAMR